MIKRLLAMLIAFVSLALVVQISPAAAAPGDYTSFVFARGANGSLYLRTRLPNGAWTGWRNLGGQMTGAPVADLLPGKGLTVFVRGTNGSVYARATTDLVNWGSWQNLGGQIVGSPAIGAATWATGAGQAQAVDLADDRVARHTTKLFCDLAGREAVLPELLEQFDPFVRPAHRTPPAP